MRGGGLLICATIALLGACVLASPAAASALEPGVHLDPGSPAEKQYVLTLNQARQTGGRSKSTSPSSTSGSAGSGSRSSSSLFGSGITPPKGGGGAGQSSNATSRPHSRTAPGAPAPVTIPTSVLRATRSQDSGGDGSLLVLLGGGLAILV